MRIRTGRRRPASRKRLVLLAVILGAVGLVLLCVMAFLAISASGFARTADRATGEVVGLEKRISCTGGGSRRSCSDVWAPRVTFTTKDGRRVTFTDSVGTWPPSHQVGDTVEVGYRGPADARIFSFWRLAFPSLITGGLGLVFGGVAVLLLVRLRRDSPQGGAA